MKGRLLTLQDRLRSSFWFVPLMMAVSAAGLSSATVALDSGPIGQKLAQSMSWLWSGGPDGARSLLSTVSSSMITVAGTVFSITIAALTLASSQFGPRLLRNFTRDRGNQLVLGTFVATFLYCLLVLRTVRSQAEGGFVPYLSVTVGVVLAVASLGVLIYFIDHVSSSIQAESLVAAVGSELKADIARLCPQTRDDQLPDPSGGESGAKQLREADFAAAHAVHAAASGYVQSFDRDALLEAAAEADLLLRLTFRPGDFVSRGDVLMRVLRPDGEAPQLPDTLADQLSRAVSLGPRRTPLQDVRYGVRQLTEIAARALSPGINDPFTATGCADWLGDALAEMARRTPALGMRQAKDGVCRLLEDPVEFPELATLSFDPLRAYGGDSALVMVHLLQLLARLGGQMVATEPRRALLDEAERTAALAQRRLQAPLDLARVQTALVEARSALARP